jgi:hypothetical protein
MDTFTAVMMVEGQVDAEEHELIEAWQYLIDTGTVWQLQGSFGRKAMDLIDLGICYDPEPHAA